MTAPDAPSFIPRHLIPTKEQTAIQVSKDRIVLVRANAGAAQTTTLALADGMNIIARGLGAKEMLALTFTPEGPEG